MAETPMKDFGATDTAGAGSIGAGSAGPTC
jgi:hypothetical protein